jgi:hypothetical protein
MFPVLITQEALRQLIKQYDQDGDGKIGEADFKHSMKEAFYPGETVEWSCDAISPVHTGRKVPSSVVHTNNTWTKDQPTQTQTQPNNQTQTTTQTHAR